MKIISRFKDYYDFVNYQYGEDTKYTWERKLFVDCPFPPIFQQNITKDEVDLGGLSYHHSKSTYDYRWLIVCGKRFLLFRQYSYVYPKISEWNRAWTAYKDSSEIEGDLYITRNKVQKLKYFTRQLPEYFMGEFSEKNLNFCIKHKSPIVVVAAGLHYFTTDSPILGDIINFVSMYPAEQIYQDISYFMMNQINGSPDLDPPVVLDDKFKIDYHGFTKESFRPKSRK